jgi:hypothetical protein
VARRTRSIEFRYLFEESEWKALFAWAAEDDRDPEQQCRHIIRAALADWQLKPPGLVLSAAGPPADHVI